MKYPTTFRIAAAAVAALAPSAIAHPGPRIWLNVDGGQVTTYAGAYPPGDPSAYARARVFTQPLVDDEGVWDNDFPGYQQVPGGVIPSGTNFSYDITGPLLWYVPQTPQHPPRFRTVASSFASAGAVPQMAVTNELFQTRVTGDGFVAGDLAYAYNGGAGDHNHLTYTLLADGATAGGGADGIYLLPLRMTAPGYAASDPFFLLLSKNADDATIAAAAIWAGKTLLHPGDANTDGVVDFRDFQLLERGFRKADADWVDGDFDGDGVVTPADFAILYRNLDRDGVGSVPADPAFLAAPEPGAGLMLTASLALLVPRRRRRSSLIHK